MQLISLQGGSPEPDGAKRINLNIIPQVKPQRMGGDGHAVKEAHEHSPICNASSSRG